MRNLARAALCALALAFTPLAAQAQIGFGIGVGPSFPTGDLSDATDAGFHGGVVLNFGLPLLPIGIRADGMFQQLSGKGDADNFRTIFGTVNGTFDLMPLPLASIYLTAGPGLYNLRNGDSTTEFGINGGLGASMNLLAFRPFVEIRYHHVMADNSFGFIPITFGLFF